MQSRVTHRSNSQPTIQTGTPKRIIPSAGQNSNNSDPRDKRLPDSRRKRRRLGTDQPHQTARCTKTIKARDLWEEVGHAAWACADPGVQYHDTVNAVAHMPRRRRNPRLQPVFRVHVPRRHGLQPCFHELADVLERRRVSGRRTTCTPHALWTVTLEISVMMAQFPSKEIAQGSYDFRTLGLGLCKHRRLADEHGLCPMTVTKAAPCVPR